MDNLGLFLNLFLFSCRFFAFSIAFLAIFLHEELGAQKPENLKNLTQKKVGR
jgi:hypothetical protein